MNITVLDYINEILDAFDKADPMGGVTESSASPAIILSSTKTVKINTKQDVEFHHLVEFFLCSTKGGRSDTCTAISFLPTRVREPYIDNWDKLVHIMKHISVTRNLTLTLSANGRGILK